MIEPIFDLPRERVFAIDDVEVILKPEPHPFEVANRETIDGNWAEETRRTPSLFDGQVALLASLRKENNILLGTAHLVRYATFLYWRRLRPIAQAEHVFAHAVLVASDGALVAIRMGQKTVNAGLVYFAAGSFEPDDFMDGHADVPANMEREVWEETGITLDRSRAESGYHALSIVSGTVLVRRYHLDQTADQIAARIRTHVEHESDPEIEGPVIIRNRRDQPDCLAPHMSRLIEWHFANPV